MKEFWTTVLGVAVFIWIACEHQEYIEQQIKWMTAHGYSQTEIEQVIEDESTPPENEWSP